MTLYSCTCVTIWIMFRFHGFLKASYQFYTTRIYNNGIRVCLLKSQHPMSQLNFSRDLPMIICGIGSDEENVIRATLHTLRNDLLTLVIGKHFSLEYNYFHLFHFHVSYI